MSVRPHIHYLAYLLRHKWHVVVFGIRLCVPLWRLLVHDWSKFTPAEWGPYVARFFSPICVGERVACRVGSGSLMAGYVSRVKGGKTHSASVYSVRIDGEDCSTMWFLADEIVRRVSVEAAFTRAFLHHIHLNAHHWQHWVSTSSQGVRPLPMPDTYIREMVADWAATGMGKSGEMDIAEWYRRERTNMVMDSDTRIAAERYIEELTGEGLWGGDGP